MDTIDSGSFKKRRDWKRRKIVVAIIIATVVFAASIGVIYYYKSYQDNNVELPLSEVIALSHDNVFSNMEINKTDAKLIVSDGIIGRASINIDDEDIMLNEGQEVAVMIGELNLNDLEDIGFVSPAKYSQSNTSSNEWVSGLMFLLFIGVLIGIFWLVMRSDLLVGRTNKFKIDKTSIYFSEVGGLNDVKENLMEAVSFLKNKKHLESIGATIPRGILLIGQPGVGKTLIARAVATESKVNFYYSTASQFHSMWVGLAALQIKKLFYRAKKTPSIIFIDEFDSLAQSRSFGSSDVGREYDHTLNQLLSEMDGFDKKSRVLVIAATNHPEVLDDAVIRPGRFDRRITISVPNYSERCDILRIYQRNKPIDNDVNIDAIAKQTAGLTGAELSSIMNEAAILAGVKLKDNINMDDINSAMDKVLAGGEREGLVLSSEDKKLVAYHEAGHALVASMLPSCGKVQRISILPRGNAGGFTRLASEKEEILVSKTKAMDNISVLLGGRVAEEIVVGNISSSAKDDIKKANIIATEMVRYYGMGDTMKLRCFDGDKSRFDNNSISEDMHRIADCDISSILNRCHENTTKIITDNLEILNRIASKLIELEVLNPYELEELLRIPYNASSPS